MWLPNTLILSKELTTGAPLSISAAEVIAQRVSPTVVPVTPVAAGVCPFPHGVTVDASVVSMSHEEIVSSVSAPAPVSMPVPVPVRAAVAVTHDTEDSTDNQLVEIFESLNDADSASDDVDYMALADEVERWLAEEESLR